MCSKLLKHRDKAHEGALYRASERWFQWVIDRYASTLRVVLRHQTITLFVTLGTLILTLYMYAVVPKGFFPVQDTGVILGISQAPETISFAGMTQKQRDLSRVILQDPDVVSLSSFIGVDGTNMTPNSGRFQINLKPRDERKSDVTDIIRRISDKASSVEGIELYMQAVQDLTVEDRVSRTQYQYSLESANPGDLATWVPLFVSKLQALPQLRDVATDQQDHALEENLVVDRDTASRLGLTTSAIDNTLYDAFGQRLVSIIFTQLNQYHVVLEVAPEFRQNPDALASLYVKSTNGQQVPLGSFSHFEADTASLTLNHQGQFPATTISFNLTPGASLGDAVQAIEDTRQSIGMPASVATSFQGTAAAFRNSLANESWLLLAAVVTVYIVLGVLYESYIHPLTILSTLPSAGVGAILALQLFHLDLGVIALIGIILLIGIVKKNAIMMIDFALEAERGEHMQPEEAIYQACLLRFRPIMMTTMAALFGALPLAMGRGTGSELRHPLGITIIGGLLFSQLLTLYTTPVVYIWFDRLASRIQGAHHLAGPVAAPQPGD
jgi:multidrug efflux pump